MTEKPCPKCGEGCVACFHAGLSHGEALAVQIEKALNFYLTHWHDATGTRTERFVGEVRNALEGWKPC